MTWERAHERAQVLAAVLSRAEQRRDGLLPAMDVTVEPGVFDSAEELLLALFGCWQRRLLARLDAVVERGDGAESDDVARVVAELARQAPGLSAIVAAHLEAPVLSQAWRRCAALVGMATGVSMEVELAGQLRGVVAGMTARAPADPPVSGRRPALPSQSLT